MVISFGITKQEKTRASGREWVQCACGKTSLIFNATTWHLHLVALFNVLKLIPLWPGTWHIGINCYKQQMLWVKTHHCTIVICYAH
jgi:hypothetical protein